MFSGLAAGLVSLVLIAIAEAASLDSSVCTPLPYVPGTTDGNAKGAPCVFPFMYNGTTYQACTLKGHHHLWCATTGNYDTDGQWGNCPATTDGSGDGDMCVFPFIYKGKTYKKCITLDHDKPWCGTKAGVDVGNDFWGECPSYTSHPLPPLPDTFTARIEWNNYNQHRTTYLEEYFDKERNIGVVIATGWLEPGVISKFISSYNTKEFYTISDMDKAFKDQEVCDVQDLSDDDIFTFPFTAKDGNDKLLGAIDALKFGSNYALVYVGPDVMDDIQVDKWEACVFIPEMGDQTLHITYYFTRAGTWGNPSTLKQVPVKQVLQGNSNYGPLNQTYDWAYFGPDLPTDPTIFEVPGGQLCSGRKSQKDLPSVPDAFSFTMETVVQASDFSYVTTSQEWYDFKGKLTRIDYVPIPGRGEFKFGKNPLRTIHDFTDGIAYFIDPYRGNCTVTPIPNDEFDDIATGVNFTRLRNPKEFFDLDSIPYFYEGQRWARGILTDSYVSSRPYPTEDSDIYATWEWFFSNKDWLVFNADKTSDAEPVKLIVRVPDMSLHQTLNFAGFKEEVPSVIVYDVTPCYRGGEKMIYTLELNGDYKGNVDRSVDLFKYLFAVTVQEVSGVRLLRVQEIEVDYNDKGIVLVSFTVVGPATIKGDISGVAPQVSIDAAAKKIDDAINGGRFTVIMTITWDDSDMVYMNAVPHSFREVTRLANGTFIDKDSLTQPGVSCPPTAQPSPPMAQKSAQQNGLTPGGDAGLAIGMLVLGALLGYFGSVLLSMCREKRQYDGKKQQLTMHEFNEHENDA